MPRIKAVCIFSFRRLHLSKLVADLYTNCLKRYLVCGWLHRSQHKFKNMHSSWNSFSQFFRNLTKSKLIKQAWSCKPMCHNQYSVILESKVKLDGTYMKMSRYENSLLPYSLHYTVKLSEWRLKDTKVSLISFLCLFTETITPERKSFFFQNYMTNIVKIDEICEELWRHHQNGNFTFLNFFLRYEACIKDKKLDDKEQNIDTNFFYFYVLKELSRKIFS